MAEGDLAGADNLRQLAGWNQTTEDWKRLLRLEPNGCFVAIHKGQIIGTVTTICYGKELAWIGMMLVHPERRRQRIGSGLMRQALDYLKNADLSCIGLDATPAGRPLYEKLGFIEEWNLTRYQRSTPTQSNPAESCSWEARSLNDDDWAVIAEMDRAAFGASRLGLLRSLQEAAISALVWPAQGRVEGWGLLRPGANSDYLGPLGCSSTGGSRPLVTELLRRADKHSVIWDIPDQNQPARTLAQEFGFKPLRSLTRMRLGPNQAASDPLAQFAIADPAVG
jgi:predicted N-acetyltransferase YhbS